MISLTFSSNGPIRTLSILRIGHRENIVESKWFEQWKNPDLLFNKSRNFYPCKITF